MRTCRLFRCSNEQGYFKVSEKCSDFCQVRFQQKVALPNVKRLAGPLKKELDLALWHTHDSEEPLASTVL